MRRSLPFLLLASFTVAGVTLAPPADAATVRVEPLAPDTPSITAQRVVVEEQGNETNRLALSYTYTPNQGTSVESGKSAVTVRDEGEPLKARDGCAEMPSGEVRCDVDELASVRVLLGKQGDTATIAPAGDMSCVCVDVFGGEGDDAITGLGGFGAHGEAGNDTLVGRRGPAKSRDPVVRERDFFAGGLGADVIDGGPGGDTITGGPGNDAVRGRTGNDFMSGGYITVAVSTPEGPAGDDVIDGGDGNDELRDGDVLYRSLGVDPIDEVGSDLVIGGRGHDRVDSYSYRTEAVYVDLAQAGRDGQAGEHDNLVNVEVVFGGNASDVIAGDGDANTLSSGAGRRTALIGRGGPDIFYASATGRHRVEGGRGDDYVESAAWARGTIRCGHGDDRVRGRVGYSRRRPDRTRDVGPVVGADCERISSGFATAWSLDPTPRLDRRTLFFRRLPGTNYRDYELVITRAEKPFAQIRRVPVGRAGARVRLPRTLAGRVERRKTALRAVIVNPTQGYPDTVRLIWRFRGADR